MGRKAKPQEERLAARRATQRSYNRDSTTGRAGPSNTPAEPTPFNPGPESPPGRPRHPSLDGSLRQYSPASEPALFDPTVEDNHPGINPVPHQRPTASSPRSSRSRSKAPSTSGTANINPPSTGTDTRSQSIDLSSISNGLNQIIEEDPPPSPYPPISQGPGGVNNTTLQPIPQPQSRYPTRASSRTAYSMSRVTAVHIPPSTSTLTSVNIPSHPTSSRLTIVTDTLALEEEDDDSPRIPRPAPALERNRSAQSERFPASPRRQPSTSITPTLDRNRSPAALPSQSSSTTTASASTYVATSARRLHAVNNTLPVDGDLPDSDDPLESRSAVSRPSDPDTYDESAASPEDDLSGLSLSDDAPDPMTAAQDCLDRSWAPLCTCSKTTTFDDSILNA
ncbi:hypothetical protein OEA41_009758 [Lepraria neglecta]|uniref:Uncharacterized protein n=1 Tax=Lepraria neglecta TaxID=209136 RepID=A0AAD9ZI41_9LECA|nr:hypothetical protein OEA41_009758 [Lepraria neglecta]